MHGGYHPKSSTLSTATKQKAGGRRLVRIRATIPDQTTKIKDYIKKMAPKLSECLRQQKASEEKEEEERVSWRDKSLHKMYYRQIEEVADIEKT